MPVRPALLAAAFALVWVGAAQAQSPWPAPPAPAGASPWPATGGNAAPAAAPAGPSPFPPAGTSASPFPPAGAGPSPFAQPQRQQPPAVCNDFVPIKEAAEKGALAIRAATGRKAPPPELCPLFKNYNATEGKMLKFMTDNKATCGIPEQVISQIKASYTKTAQISKQVCNPQAAAPGRPKAPSLGEALGTPAVPTGNNTKTGRGTYDTLSGSNPLAR